MRKYFVDFESVLFRIIFTYSEREYLTGYRHLQEKCSKLGNLDFIDQKNADFKSLVLNTIDRQRKYLLFLVDDDVFISSLRLEDVQNHSLHNDASLICLSLRMHPGIRYCYTRDIPTPPPAFLNHHSWRWSNLKGDWGYPMSLDGHLFRTDDIRPVIEQIEFNHPNIMEHHLSLNPIDRPHMQCFPKAKILNIPANKVQNVNRNRHGGIPATILNERFLNNCVISMENLALVKAIAPHMQLQYHMVSDSDELIEGYSISREL